jgi:hypothetical protein
MPKANAALAFGAVCPQHSGKAHPVSLLLNFNQKEHPGFIGYPRRGYGLLNVVNMPSEVQRTQWRTIQFNTLFVGQ